LKQTTFSLSSATYSVLSTARQFSNYSILPWIQVARNAPYFVTDAGESWTPIGQNDAITWPDLSGAFLRKDMPSVENYLANLAANGVTCLRLMLEYCQTENRYLERPIGKFQSHMIHLWDDLFTLCHTYGLRILLTPYDTFWMRKRWRKHPYNRINGGPCAGKAHWLCCKDTMQAIKNRLAFATERWGNSGVLFAWDLWNEPDPLHAGNCIDNIYEFISEISAFLRNLEIQLHGRSHLQTVSAFGPHLTRYEELAAVFFRHPALDFASMHLYDARTIDKPRDTVAPAIRTGKLITKALAEIIDNRPFLDSEHGPIHAYKHRKQLPQAFDNEYFRHIQWAHMASGAAGGGMRWPYRYPHRLTKGMRQAQKSLADFIKLTDWTSFKRKSIHTQIKVQPTSLKAFACGNSKQVIVWLLRTDCLTKESMLNQKSFQLPVNLQISGLEKGWYIIKAWHTTEGNMQAIWKVEAGKVLNLSIELLLADVALLITKM
jgi:mannan endo-1,4-beta-mannosidase